MKEKFYTYFLYLFFSLLFVLSAPAGDDMHSSVMDISVNAASELIAEDEDAVIVDVRTPIEFEASHITGSVNVDVKDESFEEMLAILDPNKKYVVHCTKNPADGRSSRALVSMEKLGFKHLYSLEGGYVAWKDAELPLTEIANSQ